VAGRNRDDWPLFHPAINDRQNQKDPMGLHSLSGLFLYANNLACQEIVQRLLADTIRRTDLLGFNLPGLDHCYHIGL